MASDSSPPDRAAPLERLLRGFMQRVPHNEALGLRLLDFQPGVATLELPFHPQLVGNPETGVLHGGVITTLIDSACGGAVMGALKEPMRVATLDLRIDYLKPAQPGRDVRCVAECYKVTRSVAFCRARADHGDAEDPIATAAGTFAIFRDPSKGPSAVEAR